MCALLRHFCKPFLFQQDSITAHTANNWRCVGTVLGGRVIASDLGLLIRQIWIREFFSCGKSRINCVLTILTRKKTRIRKCSVWCAFKFMSRISLWNK